MSSGRNLEIPQVINIHATHKLFFFLITFNYFVCLPHHLLAAFESSSSENKSCSSAHRRQAFYYVYPICFLIHHAICISGWKEEENNMYRSIHEYFTLSLYLCLYSRLEKKITTGTGRSSDDGIVYCRRFMNKAKWWRKRVGEFRISFTDDDGKFSDRCSLMEYFQERRFFSLLHSAFQGLPALSQFC